VVIDASSIHALSAGGRPWAALAQHDLTGGLALCDGGQGAADIIERVALDRGVGQRLGPPQPEQPVPQPGRCCGLLREELPGSGTQHAVGRLLRDRSAAALATAAMLDLTVSFSAAGKVRAIEQSDLFDSTTAD
jgi:hypothetical protein